jgi:zinc/manganese transport system substrate-binding protein
MMVRKPGVLLALILIGCASVQNTDATPAEQQPLTAARLEAGEKLDVAASTSIIGDVVSQIGGEHINLTVLMGPGQDPHNYEPAAANIAQLQQAAVLFMNGLDFEQRMLPTISSLQGEVPIVYVSDGVETLTGEEHGGINPHVWTDPSNVMIWASTIADTLAARDPGHAAEYRASADAYINELVNLDAAIRERVTTIPADQRKLVTNHDTMAYFAVRYGFEVIGTILPEGGEGAEPSAGELAALIQAIHESGVSALFIENTLSDSTAQIIAQEVGGDLQILTLYTDSLGPAGSEADTYLKMMSANVNTIVQGLTGQ